MSDSYLSISTENRRFYFAPLIRNEMSLIPFSLLFRHEANQQWKKMEEFAFPNGGNI